ncbi:MAG: hypothetical protein ACM3II_07285, partial [Rhodospirillaceae bacterium]
YTHHARTLMDAFKAKLPGESMTLAPAYDVWGEPVPSRGWAGTYYEHLRDDPIDRLFENLHYFPSPAARHIDGIELTDAQYVNYARLGGRMARMRVEQMVSLPGFAAMPPEFQTTAIERAISGARRQAAGAVMMQSVGSADDIMAKRRAALDAAAAGAGHEKVKELRKLH